MNKPKLDVETFDHGYSRAIIMCGRWKICNWNHFSKPETAINQAIKFCEKSGIDVKCHCKNKLLLGHDDCPDIIPKGWGRCQHLKCRGWIKL